MEKSRACEGEKGSADDSGIEKRKGNKRKIRIEVEGKRKKIGKIWENQNYRKE